MPRENRPDGVTEQEWEQACDVADRLRGPEPLLDRMWRAMDERAMQGGERPRVILTSSAIAREYVKLLNGEGRAIGHAPSGVLYTYCGVPIRVDPAFPRSRIVCD